MDMASNFFTFTFTSLHMHAIQALAATCRHGPRRAAFTYENKSAITAETGGHSTSAQDQ